MLSVKARPSELDREAAHLFSPAPGVRAWVHGAWARGVPSTLDDSTVFLPEGSSYGLIRGAAEAFDTDDPATVGVMLVQVEQAEGLGLAVEVYSLPGGEFGTSCPGEGGPTRGSALVAAIRQIIAKNAKES